MEEPFADVSDSSPFDNEADEAPNSVEERKDEEQKTSFKHNQQESTTVDNEGFTDLENTLPNAPHSSDETKILEVEKENKVKIQFPSAFYGYKVDNYIGEGACSVVFRVYNVHLKKYYAAKIISVEEMENMNLSKSVEQEIQILRSVNHPNILKYYESFTKKNEKGKEIFVIITEFCEGGNLAELIEKNGINSQNIKRILIGIARALSYLHFIGISHCDLKPDNILLDPDFNPILCDFGFATSSKLTTKTQCTLSYASPELRAQNGPYSPMISDIWSLGVTFYVIATKRFPYNCEKVISEQCIQESLSYIHDFNLRKMISDCLQIDPYKRATMKQILYSEYFMRG